MGDGPVQRVLDLLFPPRCVNCRRAGGILCEPCAAHIERVDAPVCACCGQSLAVSSAAAGTLCAYCRAGRGDPHLSGIRVAAHYRGVTRNAVRALKYSGQRRVAVPLGHLLASAYRAAGWDADMIVPLPLHPKRLASRGYNQSLLLARVLGAEVGVPVRDDVLLRWRETVPQVGLGASERRTNVAGAFRLRESANGAQLSGRGILLIDDVTTTGSTLAAAAEALAPAGPRVLWALAVARPPLGQDV